MTDLPEIYGKILLDMPVEKEAIEESRRFLTEETAVLQALENPMIHREEKHRIIEKLFPLEMWSFVKVMSDNGHTGYAREMFKAYDDMIFAANGILPATFAYEAKPGGDQIDRLGKMLCARYGKQRVQWKMVEDPSLIGGFVLTVGDAVWDKSLRTSLDDMKRRFAAR